MEDARIIWLSILRASDLLSSPFPRPRKALELISRYVHIDAIDGIERRKSDFLISLVYSVCGDCHAKLANIDEAVFWYQRACSLVTSPGCLGNYLELVVKHKLTQHYRHCLEAVTKADEEARTHRGTEPLKSKFIRCSWLISRNFYRPWVLFNLYYEHRFKGPRNKQFLREQLEHEGA